ncbi:hypothetical protein AQUCO_02700278v1 [Aquilegia coerulea]|uniref:PHD-type domain-containing protein n=1 Tax=Aquilegia coerulea TaxID=218851 RepID=A0A2G5D636_AQUCA|nr:hypothetical protein AQUCO_02700278v1 [Aquilegia coerulea]PIA38987.1 hypothetical protein AQUCO_02700278v1 [Aquilegia coerulea]
MGEEAVFLTISSDGKTMDDKCSRAVKRSQECVVDNTEAESPNKKPAIEPLNDEISGRVESNECVVDSIEVETSDKKPEEMSFNNENSFKVESKCLHECVVDAIVEVANSNKNPEEESLNDEISFKVESKCLHECVVDAIVEVTTLNKNPEEESFNNENSFKVESKCLHDECVVDAIAKVATPNNKLAQDYDNFSRLESNCINEQVVGAMEVQTLNKNLAEEGSNNEICSRAESNHSNECVVDALEVEISNKKTGHEFSNDKSSCMLESKCLSECAVDAMEVETLNRKAVQEVSVDDNSSKIESKCSNECFVDAMEVDSHSKKPEEDFSNDENSSRLELNCSNECVVDGVELETPNKKSAVEISNNECSSRVEFERFDKCDVDALEVGTPNKKLQQEVSIDENSFRVEQKSLNECVVDAIEVDIPSKNLEESFSKVDSKCSNECFADTTEVEPSNENLGEEIPDDENYTRVESKCSNECVLDATEVETSNKNSDEVSLNNENSLSAELQCLNECFRDTIDVNKKPSEEISSDENSSRVEPKYSNEFIVDGFEAETPIKHPVKESSTESSSEILDPNGSPHENASSSQTVSSQHEEWLSKSGSGDITSSNPVETCTEMAASKEGHCMNGVSSSLSKKEVVVEGSKDANTCGVKRIIIKFSKSRDIDNGVSPSTTHPSSMEVDYGFSNGRLYEEPNVNPLKIICASEDLFESTSGTRPYLYASKKKIDPKMFDRILENYTQNVKKLLSTGVLDGVEVHYVNQEKKLLQGIIKDCGYLCGCALCNFSKVLNAYEFEQHAGCKTKHPNDHVILDNGKSIYSIIQELKNAPVSSLEDVIRALVGPLFNEKAYLKWKESLESGSFQKTVRMGEMTEQSQQSHLNIVDFPRSTTSCSSEDTEDSFVSAPRPMMQKFPVKQRISTMQGISKEGKFFPKKSTSPKNTVGRNKKRDNDLHRVLFMPNGLPDGAELAYFAKGKRLLDGYKQGNGIVCSCCNNEISPSQFESHAGCAAKRQPYRHIYTSTGVSLHDLSLSLVNGHCLAISNTGSMCTVCGDGGDLIFCDACSQAFHADCLDSQCTPEGDLCCPYCKDKIGISGKVASSESSGNVRPITIRLTRVVKAPATEIGGCVVCRAPDFSVMTFDERTVMLCDQCEKEYHVGCLKKRGLGDLKELPKGKWFCCEHCSRVHATLQNLVLTGVKVIPPSMSNIIRRKLIEKGLTTEVGQDVQWQLLSGKFGPLDKRDLLSRAVAIFRDSFDPIVERSGRDLIPAMVYGKSVSGQEFGGLYCALISVKSVVVSAGLLRIFGREVAELPLVATTKESQGKGYFQALLSCIERLLCFLNVEKLVLPAAEEAESIWTNKFGFRKMTEDQFQKYTKDVQLISFKGTIMLEKAVSRGQ